ncbi:MAG: hypothetical protein Q8Q01_01565 [archaeon]|nr:hypothetical protein [archaeon]
MKKLILVLSVLALFVLVVGCVPTEPETSEDFEGNLDWEDEGGAIAGQAIAGACKDYPTRFNCRQITNSSIRYDTSTKKDVGTWDQCSTRVPGQLTEVSCVNGIVRLCVTACEDGCETVGVKDAQCVAPVAAPSCNMAVATNSTGTFDCQSYNSWCRTDNTTYSGCMDVTTHLSQCEKAGTCNN